MPRISIHAPTWGATLTVHSSLPRQNFNPRTHVGCDLTVSVRYLFVRDFNPRTHVGCDAMASPSRTMSKISIHAPTWGATGAWCDVFFAYKFQSTHPRGVRHLMSKGLGKSFVISIHAPTWGATSVAGYGIHKFNISIHAPTWGATRRPWS